MRDRLGLALAGGGFRASLFHVGVLHQLADLDLLRYVEVISGVSGGSITASLYAVFLKKELENIKHGETLSSQIYKKIVCAVEEKLCCAIRKNLRTRLLCNPLRLLCVLAWRDNLSNQMADLYDTHLFGGILLSDLRPKWARNMTDGDIEEYNADQLALQRDGNRGSVLTRLILNATTVNTGKRFWFSDSELGESHYGFIHAADISCLKERKKHINDHLLGQNLAAAGQGVLAWVIDAKKSFPEAYKRLGDSARLFKIELECLRTADLGMLRYMRNWLQRIAHDASLAGRFLPDIAWALSIVGMNYLPHARDWLDELSKNPNRQLWDDLSLLVEDVYLYRSAINVRDSIETDWSKLKLAQAVAASANFPPLFAPYQEEKFYDDLVVGRFGLTDGGVYDNMGIDGLFGQDCNYIICSDTSAPPRAYRPISGGRLGLMWDLFEIMPEYSYFAKKKHLHEAHRISEGLSRLSGGCQDPDLNRLINELHAPRELHGFAQFSINSPDDPEDDLAKLRTDLDSFNEVEMDALINRGYELCGSNYDRWLKFTEKSAPPHIRARYISMENYPYRSIKIMNSDQSEKQPDCAGPPLAVSEGALEKAVIRVGASRCFRLFRFLWKWPPTWGKVMEVVFILLALFYPGRAVIQWIVTSGQRDAAPHMVAAYIAKAIEAVLSVHCRYPLSALVFFLLAIFMPKWLYKAAACLNPLKKNGERQKNCGAARALAKMSLYARVVSGWLAAASCGAWVLEALNNYEKVKSSWLGGFISGFDGSSYACVAMVISGSLLAVAVSGLACIFISLVACISYGLSRLYLSLIDSRAKPARTA